jgi:hypothetical protein
MLASPVLASSDTQHYHSTQKEQCRDMVQTLMTFEEVGKRRSGSHRGGLRQRTGEGYTMRGLCLGLGVDHRAVTRWIEAGWLKGTRRQSERATRDIWYFSDQAIRVLVREHPSEIDPRRVDWLWLVDVLLDCGNLAAHPAERMRKEQDHAARSIASH